MDRTSGLIYIASLPVRSRPHFRSDSVLNLTPHRKFTTGSSAPKPEVDQTGSGNAAMKLLTHNLLTSHVRGLQPGAGYPFHIRASEVRVRSVPFNATFVARLIPRLHWETLLSAAESVGHPPALPPRPPPPGEDEDEDFLRQLHHVLMEVEVMEGELQCPDSGRRFPITGGVPNLLLTDGDT